MRSLLGAPFRWGGVLAAAFFAVRFLAAALASLFIWTKALFSQPRPRCSPRSSPLARAFFRYPLKCLATAADRRAVGRVKSKLAV
jgi:hypothetical protein